MPLTINQLLNAQPREVSLHWILSRFCLIKMNVLKLNHRSLLFPVSFANKSQQNPKMVPYIAHLVWQSEKK